MLHEGRSDLLTVTSASTLDGYPDLRSRADSIEAAAKVGDFVLRLLDDREQNLPAYNLLANMIGLLDADPRASRPEVGLAFRAKMLLAAGFSPELGSCVHCGATEDLVAFSPSAGGVVCRDCRVVGDVDFDADAHTFLTTAEPEARRMADKAITQTLAHHANVRIRELA
jgi:DNA repair protein RecO (recombination protein O)